MTHDVVMPQLGLTMTEGSVSVWLKKPGERVEKGEALFSVTTDKVEMEVESTCAGYLTATLVEPEQVVPVGTVIARIGDRQDEAQEQPGGHPASPLARRLAKELGVDLQAVTPAKGHRISGEDVQRAHAAAAAAVVSSPPRAETPKLSSRAKIAERMTRSFQTAPHFYLGLEVDATRLVEFRSCLLPAGEKQGIRITYTDFFLKAMAVAISEQPGINRYWQDGQVLGGESIDIGFAAQTEDTLVVPVVRCADRLGLFEMAGRRSELAGKARAGRLVLADVEGGTATLSNLGSFGVDWFQAILNPPQSIIVAAGRIAKRPAVVGGVLAARDTVTLTASVDHRVLDGVAAARFLTRVKALLEEPGLLL